MQPEPAKIARLHERGRTFSTTPDTWKISARASSHMGHPRHRLRRDMLALRAALRRETRHGSSSSDVNHQTVETLTVVKGTTNMRNAHYEHRVGSRRG
eukprot:2224510-Pyramimonas_sp.AAC.1